MSLADAVAAEVKRIFQQSWTTTKTTKVPTPESIALERNDAKELDDAVVLYADLAGSTRMVQSQSRQFAAEVYRAYLYSAAQIIRNEGGDITAYDGDRIMAVFVGSSPNSDATRCALKINYAVKQIVNPAITAQYGQGKYTVQHVVGVDRSALFVARTGVRGDNDLVWVGRAANYAAKLTEISNDASTFITGDVFDRLQDASKYGGNPKQLMWTERQWSQMSNMRIYSSTWWWKP
jgi:class 3 adenylate cyclase